MPETLEKLRSIVTDPGLSPAQKARFLSLEAENMLPYPKIDDAVAEALAEGVLCDLAEGHAPYKPRYVVPDYAVLLKNGSAYLELDPPETLDEAITCLMIAWHHVPSVTAMPVFIGHIDRLLLPFCEGVGDEDLRAKLRLLWRYIDRVLPDAFLHVNIGPEDNRVARAVLDVDSELKQIAPNLTLLYDPETSGEALLRRATDAIITCSKPHVANHPLHTAAFDARGYAIVSCYNALPLAGGAATLVRLNLHEAAKRATDTADFADNVLPRYMDLQFRLIEARMGHLFEHSGFFENFIVTEGWVDRDRFTAMFGIYGMAEAVNHLQDLEGRAGRYGLDAEANALGLGITRALADRVEATPVEHAWRGQAMLHAQAGISTDIDATPGVRIPYGSEPDPVTHVMALAPHHLHYPSGVSEILTIDETVKANPRALFTLAKGALASGFRDFTANVAGGDLVRVTGYMIRLSDLEKFRQDGGSRTNTTALGAEAAELTRILERKPRVIGHEFAHGYGQ
ncbi:YjjI family glycine radical enzyme [Tropicimonas sp. IMCC6043]|uniref:YjjI family glycine radical enzyme n=1 Tax=Tropicimonas sp. IMCC6043 TaxID=2510645 RepID=UPI00101CA8FA|nr:YjjI family glycine radical enzyme [Tropicimonas sp. IMCC6043]RYH10915.1 YjjI family glycine radical enzyme [Tropicimonas sp. IMCC6043]